MSPVKASPINPTQLVEACCAAARNQGFRVEQFGERAGVPLVALTRRAPGVCPRIYLSSGVHGDEPAPPQSLLTMLSNGFFSPSINWFIIMMLNPTGFNASTRENAEGIDLNRDYLNPRSAEVTAHVQWLRNQPRFDLAVCLHEDWEATGLYLYELNCTPIRSTAQDLIAAGQTILPLDPAKIIDGRPIDEPGIIRPESDPALRDTWPEAIYLREHHTALCYTIETPSTAPLSERIAAQVAMVAAAVDRVTKQHSARLSEPTFVNASRCHSDD